MAAIVRPSVFAHWRTLRALLRRVACDSLLRNSIFMMGTTVVNSVLGYAFWILAARTNTTHDVGLANALISAMVLASAISGVGIGSTLVQVLPSRRPGRDRSQPYTAGLAAGVLSGVVAGVIAFIILPLFSPQFSVVLHNSGYAVAFIIGVPTWTILSLLDYTFVAERAAGNMLIRNGIGALLKILFLVIAVTLSWKGALSIFGSTVLSSGFAAMAGFILVWKLGQGYRIIAVGIMRQVRAMFSALVGHHLINLGGLAPQYLLPLIVTARLSATDNAYFSTTWMVGGVFFIISPAVAGSLFAEGSHTARDLRRKVRSSLRIIGALLAPAMLFYFVAGRFILGAFKPEYASHGVVLLDILIVAAVPDAITNVYVSVLRVNKKLRHAAFLNLAMAAVTLVIAWVTLPSQGIAGAGWAWLIGQIAGSIGAGVHVLVCGYRQAPRIPVDRNSAMDADGDGRESTLVTTATDGLRR